MMTRGVRRCHEALRRVLDSFVRKRYGVKKAPASRREPLANEVCLRKTRILLILLALFAGLHQAHGMDVRITGGKAGLHYVAEYNRALLFCWNVAATKTLDLNSRHDIRAGISLGEAGDVLEIRWFAGGAIAPFANASLRFAVEYLHGGLPEYEYRSDTLRVLTSLDRSRWGLAVGPALRFSSFFGERSIFEPVLSWSIHAFLVNNGVLRLGLRVTNFTEFVSRNMGDHFLNLNTRVRLSQRIALVNEINIHQSGASVLASNFYGVAYRGGLLFLW